MSSDDIKDFLRSQARSLDSLLALTPAKHMFGEDVSDQYKRKKQTPEQKRAARVAKLDPANWKSAKDVYDERNEAAKKRKRGDEEVQSDVGDASVTEQNQQQRHSKKAKTISQPGEILGKLNGTEDLRNQNTKKRAKKRANRLARKEEQKAKADARKTQSQNTPNKSAPEVSATQTRSFKEKKAESVKPGKTEQQGEVDQDNEDEQDKVDDAEVDEEDEGEEDTMDLDDKASPQTSDDDSTSDGRESVSTTSMSDILSPPLESASSSVSSVQPAAAESSETATGAQPQGQNGRPSQPTTTEPREPLQTDAERHAARQRLQEQILQLRSQRKADDKPARSRAELLAQRREKEAERKAVKKEERRKEKDEEARRLDEEIAKRFSPGGSGSLLASPRSPIVDNGNFSYGRIAFEDGTQLDQTTFSAADQKKRKGPADAASAVKAAESKAARLAGFDDEKKKEIAEKDMWLNAKKRAHGERVKDDLSLLKKALKRQEKQKNKSGKDWDARAEGVRATQESKQKKRTENLQKRKDEKTAKKGKKAKRPGFEGSFRGRTGKAGGKKK